MDYFDTSLLVTLLSRERLARPLDEWMQARPQNDRSSSLWVVAEFSSALALKLRIGALDPLTRALTHSQFNRLRQSFQMLPIEAGHFLDAANMVDRAHNLRAPDALHLAIARASGATVWTLDADMVKAAKELSLPVAMPEL